MRKKTKIVATISDLCCDVEFIKKLYKSGMNVVRLNTAHQTMDATLKVIENVRKVSERIALLLDTKGPEIRTNDSPVIIELNEGDIIKLKGQENIPSEKDCINVNYNNFIKQIKPGNKILIDDGDIELVVNKIENDTAICKAANKGNIKGKKSVNVPGISFSLPALSKKDKDYIEFAINNDIDFIAHSFVRNKEDVLAIRNILDKHNSKIKIIAKIENQEGVDKIDEILDYVYGIMVARGDLAIEIPYEKIPGIQKKIINKCIDARKPVIVATQMLHSMIENPRPTRAEVTDVANAIYSKTDAIMLSGETAYGKYPVEAVCTMSKIAREVEESRGDIHNTPIVVLSSETSAYLSKSAVEASLKLDAKAIIADTRSGRTIRNMAAFRGRKVIFAQCYEKRVVKELALSFGVYANYIEPNESLEFIKESLEKLIKADCLKKEDRVVVLGGNFGFSHGASFIEISSVQNLINR